MVIYFVDLPINSMVIYFVDLPMNSMVIYFVDLPMNSMVDLSNSYVNVYQRVSEIPKTSTNQPWDHRYMADFWDDSLMLKDLWFVSV